jgi:hypothetical protein
LQESETNDFDGIATGDESWFQHITASSKMLVRSAAYVIPRRRQAVGAEKTMIRVFFTAKKLTVFDVLSRRSIFNQLHFIKNIFPDLKTANLILHGQKAQSTFWVHMGNFTSHNGSTVAQKIKKNHISRMMQSPDSPDVSPCDFCLFEVSQQILTDREFSSNAEIEEAIAEVWNYLTFDEVQSVLRDWIRRLAWVAENSGEYISD